MTRLLLALVFLAACSDGSSDDKSPPSDDDTACTDCRIDAGALDASRRDASKAAQPIQADASLDELRAQVQVNGAKTVCGSCSVLIAQAQGGVLPYHYEWNDPSLQGPGPHMVCPSEPKRYSVIVSDSADTIKGEFARPVQSVEAFGETNCVSGDAGGGLKGCTTNVAADAGADAAAPTCGDAGVSFELFTGAQGTVTVSTELNEGIIKAGETYEYSHDRLIPITLSIGQAVTVDVYGANEVCGEEEKFFSLTYDLFTWHQAFCFTPKKDYRYMIVAVHLNGVLFSWEFLTAGTLCAGCSTQP